jgi:hypothetical protein
MIFDVDLREDTTNLILTRNHNYRRDESRRIDSRALGLEGSAYLRPLCTTGAFREARAQRACMVYRRPELEGSIPLIVAIRIADFPNAIWQADTQGFWRMLVLLKAVTEPIILSRAYYLTSVFHPTELLSGTGNRSTSARCCHV